MRKTLFTGMLAMTVYMLSAQQNIYVATSGDDNNNSGALEFPYATLSKAVETVEADGAVIHIASGTYVCSQEAIVLPYDLTIIGEDAANTIIDGDETVALIDAITQMQGSNKTLTVSGLTFRDGRLESGSIPGGSAIRSGAKTNLTVTDCYFYNNYSRTANETFGGAIYFTGNNITVDRCFFEDNQSLSTGTGEGYGGALTIRHLQNIDGSGTHTSLGATYAVVKNSTFYHNSCTSKGGAIYFNKQINTGIDDDDATFIVQNCTFLENNSLKGIKIGAAISLSSGANNSSNKEQTIILTNNTFVNNSVLDATSQLPSRQSAVLLEGFRYVAYIANNLITNGLTDIDESMYANQSGPVEYGMNNIIDSINANINGTDFTTEAEVKHNYTAAITPNELGISTTLSRYPLGTNFTVPYLTVSSTSAAVNRGTDSYLINTIANPAPADPVEYILQQDITGATREGARDLGAYEYITPTLQNIPETGKITILREGNIIRLIGIEPEDVIRMYDSKGVMVYARVPGHKTETRISLPHTGLYIISVNGKSVKYFAQ